VLALAGAVAVIQGDEDREGAEDAVEGIGEGVLHGKGRAVDVARKTVQSGRARQAEPIGADVAERSVEAGCRHREHDDVRPGLAELRVAETQLVHHARSEVLRDDVAAGDQIEGQLHGLRLLQVEAHAAVAGPAGVIGEAAVRVALPSAEGRQGARHVDPGVGLDLVDLGPEEGEGLTRDRTGPDPSEVRNADPLQGERS
jgi:hypothetical protein